MVTTGFMRAHVVHTYAVKRLKKNFFFAFIRGVFDFKSHSNKTQGSNVFLYSGEAKKDVMSYSPNRSTSRSPPGSPRRRSASPKARDGVDSDEDYQPKETKEPEVPQPRPPRRGCAFIHTEQIGRAHV